MISDTMSLTVTHVLKLIRISVNLALAYYKQTLVNKKLKRDQLNHSS